MGGQDQVPVVPPGEPLRLAFAAAVHPQVVEQVRPVLGPAAGRPGPASTAGHWRTRAPAAPCAARPPAGPTAVGSAAPATPGPSTAAPPCRRPARPGATAEPTPR